MKIFKQIILAILFFLIFSFKINGQISPLILDFQTSIGDYFNRDRVNAIQGFIAAPSGTDKVHLYIDPNIQLQHSYSTATISQLTRTVIRRCAIHWHRDHPHRTGNPETGLASLRDER